MNLSSVVVGREYFFQHGGDVYRGEAAAVGDKAVVFLLTEDSYPYRVGHKFARVDYQITAEVPSPVVEPPVVSDREYSPGPRRINLDDGKKPAPRPAKRWWQFWRTN